MVAGSRSERPVSSSMPSEPVAQRVRVDPQSARRAHDAEVVLEVGGQGVEQRLVLAQWPQDLLDLGRDGVGRGAADQEAAEVEIGEVEEALAARRADSLDRELGVAQRGADLGRRVDLAPAADDDLRLLGDQLAEQLAKPRRLGVGEQAEPALATGGQVREAQVLEAPLQAVSELLGPPPIVPVPARRSRARPSSAARARRRAPRRASRATGPRPHRASRAGPRAPRRGPHDRCRG